MGRELRKVPEDWEHPKDGNPRGLGYKPLFEGNDGAYEKEAKEWHEGYMQWANGEHEVQIGKSKYAEECIHWWEYHGQPPDKEDYMPDFGNKATHFMLYEDTTEGTPVSPAFETLDELCAYAERNCTTFANNKVTKAKWKEMLEKGFVHHTSEDGNVKFG